jgi:DNA-binding NarL/FixJ family response regulator
MAATQAPDVIVMDFHLPDGTGDQAAAAIRKRQPTAAIIFVSADESEEALLAAVRAGASGFLNKATVAADVVRALRRAADGEMLIPASRLASLLARAHDDERAGAERGRLRALLTPREKEVLALMAQGLRNGEIAVELGIGLTTVRGYVQDILEKLDCHSKLEAVLVAARHDLLAA